MRRILFLAIVKNGLASKIVQEAKQVGITGGTILKAEGTVVNKFVNMLGLHDSKREIVLIVAPKDLQEDVHRRLEKKFNLQKDGHGVLFSFAISSCIGSSKINIAFDREENEPYEYQAMFVIVDRPYGNEIVQYAREAGGQGATILHGRGTGTHEVGKLFNLAIEPEKEIVVMVVSTEEIEELTAYIERESGISEAGKGIIFTIPVKGVLGLGE